MNGWLHYVELQAKAKTGLSSGVVVWAIIGVVCGAVTFGLLIFTAFIWLSQRYSPLTAALILTGFFLLITIIALIASMMAHNRTAQRAKQELAVRSNQPWFDPKYLMVGMQAMRAIGFRRIVPLVAVGMLAAGLAKEWASRSKSAGEAEADEGDDDQVDEREAA